MHGSYRALKTLEKELAPFAMQKGSQFQLEIDSDTYRGEVSSVKIGPNKKTFTVEFVWFCRVEKIDNGIDPAYFRGEQIAPTLCRPMTFVYSSFYPQRKKKRVKVKVNDGSEAWFFLPENFTNLDLQEDGSFRSRCTVQEYLGVLRMPRSFVRK